MTESVHHLGPSETPADADRLILHVEPDESIRAEAAAAIECHDELVDIVAVSSVEAAETLLSEPGADCLVVGTAITPAFVEAADPPVVLYSGAGGERLDETLLAAADTYIERQPDGDASFLARKAIAMADRATDDSRARDALSRALSRAEDPAEGQTYQFLVDDDGQLRWGSAPFEEAFPVDQLATPLPDSDNFDARLQALLADAPEAIRTVFRTRRGASECPSASVSVPTADGEMQFVHTGYRLPGELDSLRLEQFEDVSAAVHRDARMDLLEVLVETSKDGLYTLDAQGDIEFCNASFAGMLGYDVDELVGRHASTVLQPGELERGQETVAELQDDEDRDSETIDLAFETRSGERLDMSVHFALLAEEAGSYSGLMGVARDITPRKRRERDLQRYRQLVEAARDPMFVLDAAGRVTLCNEALERTVDAETPTGRRLTNVFGRQDGQRIEAVLKGLRCGDDEWGQYELRLTDPTGTERLYEATVGALRDGDGYAGTVGTLRDVTERTRRTQELDLLKQVLARVLRHNIRSKLTVVRSYADRLVDGAVDPQAAGEAIGETADSLLGTAEKAREIERLVDNDADRTTISLDGVVSSALEGVAADHPDASIPVDLPDVAVRAHPSLETAVENAVENALVHIEDPTVELTAEVTDDTVTLLVDDDGPGIPPTDIAAIEQREETPLQHTSGAGLWLIDWVVDRSGGSLSLDTGPDGTTVRMTVERAGGDTVS